MVSEGRLVRAASPTAGLEVRQHCRHAAVLRCAHHCRRPLSSRRPFLDLALECLGAGAPFSVVGEVLSASRHAPRLLPKRRSSRPLAPLLDTIDGHDGIIIVISQQQGSSDKRPRRWLCAGASAGCPCQCSRRYGSGWRLVSGAPTPLLPRRRLGWLPPT